MPRNAAGGTSSERIPHPAHIYIDIGNACNLRCPFCVTGAKAATSAPTLMSLDQYEIILSKIARSAKIIGLYNWGEPLLNPALFDMVRATAAFGIDTHIDSNLSLHTFNDAAADRMVASGLGSLFASIDGVTQATYQKYRVRGRLDLVFHNIRLVQEAKERAGSNTPFIGWNYHVHRYNEHEIGAARDRSRELGVPIQFKHLSTPDDAWKSSFDFSNNPFIEQDAQLPYTPPSNAEHSGLKLHALVPHVCRQMFQGTMTIAPTGDVYPCTTVEGKPFSMGNMLMQSLDDVWNGARFDAARKYLKGFGPVQNSGTPCETLSCPLACKSAPVGRPLGEGDHPWMFSHVRDVLSEAERSAHVQTRDDALAVLRRLPLDDFGEVMVRSPLDGFPKLAQLLPPMPSEAIQLRWNGASDLTLLRQSIAFVRSCWSNHARLTGRQLGDAPILDFGCGWGRLARLMYYFAGTRDVFGIDPGRQSLELCVTSRLGSNFLKSDPVLRGLPTGNVQFGFAYAFSVFTHLSEPAATAALNAVREAMAEEGIFCITVRPAEYWSSATSALPPVIRDRLREGHASKGYGFHAHDVVDDGLETHFGEAALSVCWLERHAVGWTVAAIDRSMDDPHQLLVFLRACPRPA